MEYTEKQIQILEVAERLFSENGFAGTSVRDISHDAGVNLAMISYYFGSKEKLLEAIFKYRSAATRVQLETLIQDDSLNPMQKVEQLVDYYVKKILSEQCFHRIMMREQMVEKESILNQHIMELKKANHALITKIIQEGQKTGAFKKKIDIPLMLITMFGAANQLLSTKHYYKELNNLQDMDDDTFQAYLKKKLSIHLKSLFKAMLTYEI